jgi:hypothetical protein
MMERLDESFVIGSSHAAGDNPHCNDQPGGTVLAIPTWLSTRPAVQAALTPRDAARWECIPTARAARERDRPPPPTFPPNPPTATPACYLAQPVR